MVRMVASAWTSIGSGRWYETPMSGHFSDASCLSAPEPHHLSRFSMTAAATAIGGSGSEAWNPTMTALA